MYSPVIVFRCYSGAVENVFNIEIYLFLLLIECWERISGTLKYFKQRCQFQNFKIFIEARGLVQIIFNFKFCLPWDSLQWLMYFSGFSILCSGGKEGAMSFLSYTTAACLGE
jgi:hypothetical protein